MSLESKNRVYMDACCLNRPFDDLTQDRVRMEAEAVITILKRVSSGEYILVSSDAISIEISQMPDLDRKEKVLSSANFASVHVTFNDKIKKRAQYFEQVGIYGYDALHIACAEEGKVEVFFSTDDGLLKKFEKNVPKPKMRVINPLAWVNEVI
jgi:predicted nucleic acid-binding protein